jgi:hypothetical protein
MVAHLSSLSDSGLLWSAFGVSGCSGARGERMAPVACAALATFCAEVAATQMSFPNDDAMQKQADDNRAAYTAHAERLRKIAAMDEVEVCETAELVESLP